MPKTPAYTVAREGRVFTVAPEIFEGLRQSHHTGAVVQSGSGAAMVYDYTVTGITETPDGFRAILERSAG